MNESRLLSLAEKGKIARIRSGSKTDRELLDFISDNPGSSIYDIKVGLNWTIGRVQGSIRRLEEQEKISVKKSLKGGRISKLIYDGDFRSPPTGTIIIDKKLLDNLEDWKKQVFVYALNITTMTITPKESESLGRKSLHRWIISFKMNEKEIVVNLPQKVVDFYKLQNGKTDVLSDGKKIFVDVDHPLNFSNDDERSAVDMPTDHRILILEDDKKYARTLRSTLNKYFESIDLVFTEGEATEKIKQKEYDYAILDWDIEHKKAAERVFRWIKERGCNFPTMVITSQDYTEEDETRFKELGFASFLDKTTLNFPRILGKRILKTLMSK